MGTVLCKSEVDAICVHRSLLADQEPGLTASMCCFMCPPATDNECRRSISDETPLVLHLVKWQQDVMMTANYMCAFGHHLALLKFRVTQSFENPR